MATTNVLSTKPFHSDVLQLQSRLLIIERNIGEASLSGYLTEILVFGENNSAASAVFSIWYGMNLILHERFQPLRDVPRASERDENGFTLWS